MQKKIMIVPGLLALALTSPLVAASGDASQALEAAKEKVTAAVDDAKTKIFQWLDKEHVTLNFKTGSTTLPQNEIDELKTLVDASKNKAAIEKVIVATWSDKEYPAGSGEKLSDADRKLAEQRADTIKKALSSLGVAKVETFSMAEHPSWIAKTFNTEQAKVKGQGEVKSADDALASEIGKKLRENGGPGTAVVLVRRAGDFSTH